ncbi:hypothetical protein KAS08_03695 [Candidatus Pacearchaeota archaeon]|nr:hypothetical protein [Candidatus Pacearchaeota archaeon]
MKFKNILKIIGKNLLGGISGAIVGIIISIFYVIKIWVPMNVNEIGLIIIVLIPVMIILFSILGMLVGGVFGILIYQIIRLIRKRRVTIFNEKN